MWLCTSCKQEAVTDCTLAAREQQQLSSCLQLTLTLTLTMSLHHT